MPDLLPDSERTRATEARYQADKLAGNTIDLLDEPAKVWLSENWAKKDNRYPYDARWRSSELLVFSRRCTWSELTEAERLEFYSLLPALLDDYDAIKLNGISLQSVKTIPHVHLLRGLIA